MVLLGSRLTILALTWATPVLGAPTPKSIIEGFFGPRGLSDQKNVYTGEMLRYAGTPTLGQQVPLAKVVSCRILYHSTFRSVYDVLFDNGSYTGNWYAYFQYADGAWKLSAVRTLALTGMIWEKMKQLQKEDRSPAEEATYQNAKLTLATDNELKSYLQSHLAGFDKLIQLDQAGKAFDTDVEAKKLYMNSVGPLSDYPGIIDVNIGGIVDNFVGYLYVPSGKQAPAISDDSFIYVEHVVGPWYVYKTT